mmetsp:Transcript_18058/g.22204  ORF Transcript_18058/g.22204 Transcript_18058/m.22204 type:complete len:505 (+) Transcript_18058:142-1656(+)
MSGQDYQKVIRELQRKKSNKQCMECGERGPGYVCTNFNTFVCTGCSGILREFNFRVKGISMSTFTKEEVENLKRGGNAKARKVYLAEWDEVHDGDMQPESGDRIKIRNFIKAKYVDERFVKGSKKKKKKKIKKKCSSSSDSDHSDVKKHRDADSASSSEEDIIRKKKTKSKTKAKSKTKSRSVPKIVVGNSVAQQQQQQPSIPNDLNLLDFSTSLTHVPASGNTNPNTATSSDDLWGDFQASDQDLDVSGQGIAASSQCLNDPFGSLSLGNEDSNNNNSMKQDFTNGQSMAINQNHRLSMNSMNNHNGLNMMSMAQTPTQNEDKVNSDNITQQGFMNGQNMTMNPNPGQNMMTINPGLMMNAMNPGQNMMTMNPGMMMYAMNPGQSLMNMNNGHNMMNSPQPHQFEGKSNGSSMPRGVLNGQNMITMNPGRNMMMNTMNNGHNTLTMNPGQNQKMMNMTQTLNEDKNNGNNQKKNNPFLMGQQQAQADTTGVNETSDVNPFDMF